MQTINKDQEFKIDIRVEEPSDSSNSPSKTPPDTNSLDALEKEIVDDVNTKLAQFHEINDDLNSIPSDDGGISLGENTSIVEPEVEEVIQQLENRNKSPMENNASVSEQVDDVGQVVTVKDGEIVCVKSVDDSKHC